MALQILAEALQSANASSLIPLAFISPSVNALGAAPEFSWHEPIEVSWTTPYDLTTVQVVQGPMADGSYMTEIVAANYTRDQTSAKWEATPLQKSQSRSLGRRQEIPSSLQFRIQKGDTPNDCAMCTTDSVAFRMLSSNDQSVESSSASETSTASETSATSDAASSATSATSSTSSADASTTPESSTMAASMTSSTSASATSDEALAASTSPATDTMEWSLAQPDPITHDLAVKLGLGLGLGIGLSLLLLFVVKMFLRRRRLQRKSQSDVVAQMQMAEKQQSRFSGR